MKALRTLILLWLTVMPLHAAWAAASLTATVDDEPVAAGEPLTLQLTLTGAEAKGDPDLAALDKDFTIAEQGRSSETSFVNGHMSSSLGWQIVLLPRHGGDLTIPSLSVATDGGTVSSQPVKLHADHVQSGGAPSQTSAGIAPVTASASQAIDVTASASTTTPFRDQPILYTLRVVTRASVADIAPGDIKVDNAIVTPQGRPEVEDGNEQGQPVKIIAFHYVITPLQAGSLTIAPVSLQGRVEIPAAQPRPRPHRGMIDPFELMQAMGGFPGMTEMRPFAVTGNPVTLNVRAPVAGVEPWLPLTGLEMKESIDLDGPFRVGEPIVRRLTLNAQGIGGDQLPDLTERTKGPGLRVYADKPANQTTVTHGHIEGSRTQSLNLIPTEAGTVEIPAVKVQWYDVARDRIETAEVPAHTVTVAAAPNVASAAPTAPDAAPAVPAAAPPARPAIPGNGAMSVPVWTWDVGGLGLLVLLFIAYRAGQNTRRTKGYDDLNGVETVAASRATGPIAWDQLHSAGAVQAALIAHARARWDLDRHGSLEDSFVAGPGLTDAERAEGRAALRALDGALYGGQTGDLNSLKSRLRAIVALRDRAPQVSREGGRLPPLNPL